MKYIATVLLLLMSNAYAVEVKSICYINFLKLRFGTTRTFTVNLREESKSEIDLMTVKLQSLFGDHLSYVGMKKNEYEKAVKSVGAPVASMAGVPTCLLYPESIEKSVILPSVEMESAKYEAKGKMKTIRFNWPDCPGTIKLHSSYNYIGIPVETQCF